MSALSVAVIVLNYRGDRVLRACLTSLALAIGPDDQVLVVDNGNESTLLASVREDFPQFETISLEVNRGFAAGMNFGIRHMLARGNFDAFWLMNNDAQVAPDGLSALKRAALTKGNTGLFSPIIYLPDNDKPWFAGGEIDFLRMRVTHSQSPLRGREPQLTKFLTGCALFIPREAIERIGFLDERYFLYYEDAEYSLRARRQGLDLWVVPSAHVTHSEESRKSAAKIYWLVRSGTEFFLRESRGIWRVWIMLYFPLRRLKNTLTLLGDVNTDQTVAKEVKRAYTDASL
ncbi:MAG: glycosyltransferase family 2 protein [Candidatus Moraniibacteriota bacterium]